MKKYSFSAVIENAGGGGAFVRVPIDAEKEFGRKRVKIRATIDGEPYRGSLAWMGGLGPILGVLKEIRAKTGKDIGDKVEVVLWEDTELRIVEIPADLKNELHRHAGMLAAFEKMPYTLRKEYALYINAAKRESMRRARIAKVIEKLK
jgi:hypothetical protein